MTKAPRFDRFITTLLGVFGVAHVALAALVPNLEEKFQLGDRAWDRSAKIDAIMAAKDWNAVVETVFYYSSPGDYVFFLPAYATLGAPGVIAQNIVLFLVGIYFLYRLGLEVFSPAVARTAVIAYALLPSTLFHPQAFVTESLSNPLLIVATYYAARFLKADRPAMRDMLAFALTAAIIGFARNMFVLFPFAVAALMLIRMRPWRAAVWKASVVVLVSLTLLSLWQAALWTNTGRYDVAPSFHGLSSNLFIRAERMARMGDFKLLSDTVERRSMSVTDFVGVTLEHPGSFARSAVSDAVNMIANTGVTMAYGRYLGLFDLKEASDKDTFKWRDIRDTQGSWAMLAYLWHTSPVALLLNLVFFLAWAILLLIALYGFLRILRSDRHNTSVIALLAAVPFYVFTFSFAAGAIRWDHRSPMEFIICLFFALGTQQLMAALGQHRAAGGVSTTSAKLHMDKNLTP